MSFDIDGRASAWLVDPSRPVMHSGEAKYRALELCRELGEAIAQECEATGGLCAAATIARRLSSPKPETAEQVYARALDEIIAEDEALNKGKVSFVTAIEHMAEIARRAREGRP